MTQEGDLPLRKTYADVTRGKRTLASAKEKSFDDVARDLKLEVVAVRDASIFKNEPFIQVSQEEIQKLAHWFKHGLVGNFLTKNLPSI